MYNIIRTDLRNDRGSRRLERVHNVRGAGDCVRVALLSVDGLAKDEEGQAHEEGEEGNDARELHG